MTLKADVQAVIDAAGIEAGFSVWQVESGEQIEINGSELFPMASVFKIPILAAAGQQIAQGRIAFDTRVPLQEEDKTIGSGILPFFEAGLTPTVRDLLTLMIIISDNTATDMNIRMLGGPQVIEAALRDLGLKDIYLKMNCKELLKALFPPEVRDLPSEDIQKWEETHDILRDGVVFSRAGDNNVSAALDMTRLVYMLYQGQVVEGALKDDLIGIMLKQQLNQRLPRFLPPNVRFAHKTGTIAGIRNDSGVMYISDENHVVVTLFTFWDNRVVWQQPVAEQQRIFEIETAMGKVGRLVYDHYSSYSG